MYPPPEKLFSTSRLEWIVGGGQPWNFMVISHCVLNFIVLFSRNQTLNHSHEKWVPSGWIKKQKWIFYWQCNFIEKWSRKWHTSSSTGEANLPWRWENKPGTGAGECTSSTWEEQRAGEEFTTKRETISRTVSFWWLVVDVICPVNNILVILRHCLCLRGMTTLLHLEMAKTQWSRGHSEYNWVT